MRAIVLPSASLSASALVYVKVSPYSFTARFSDKTVYSRAWRPSRGALVTQILKRNRMVKTNVCHISTALKTWLEIAKGHN